MQKSYRIFLGLILASFSFAYILLFINAGVYLLLHDPKAMDFIAFYTGAQLLAQSPADLYNLHSQLVVQQQVAHIPPSLFIAYVNPPFVALLFEPLLRLGLVNAYALWTLLNGFFLLFICYIAYQQFPKNKWYWIVVFFICIMTCIPVLTGLIIGQFSIVLTLIFLLSWIFLKKGWDFRSGLILSLLLIKPQLLLLPFTALVVQRRSKTVYGMLIGILFWILLSYMLVGGNGMLTYSMSLNDAYHGDLRYDIGLMAQHSLQTFFLILFHTQSLSKIYLPWLITVILLLIPNLFIWSKKTSVSSAHFSLQFVLLIIITLITSPHTHFHDLSIMLVVPIVLFSIIHKIATQQRKILIFVVVLGYLIQLIGYFFEVQTKTLTNSLWIVINVIYLIIFSFILLRQSFRSRIALQDKE